MPKVFVGNTEIYKTFLGNDSTFPSFSATLDIEYLIVAGGGAGGFDNGSTLFGGGGGAGGYLTGSVTLNVGDSKSAVIGAGGIFNSNLVRNGQNSTFDGKTAIGGGGGGQVSPPLSGGNGGSGGGQARDISNTIGSAGSALQPGSTDGGFGNNGGTCGGSPTNVAGGGGGADSAGSKGVAGNGKNWVDGITYARGGYSSTPATANTGHGGNRNSNGQSGIVKLRYLGIPRATGGTITESGGYTYHTFTTTGTFTYSG
jgi:hypothetical protein